MTDLSEFKPDWVSPPGDTIEDLLEERGWTKAELAERTGFTPKHINALVKGTAPITAETAERLSLSLGPSVAFWLEREAQFRALEAERDAFAALADDAEWLRELPVRWMEKQGWVEASSSRGARVASCLRFFGVASVEAWRSRYQTPLAAFRASPRWEKRVGAVAAWLREGERRATELRCKPFNRAGFVQTLAELRLLTREPDREVLVSRLTGLCARQGVAVVLVPAPPGAPASGATRWLTPHKAMLLLSLRYKTDDHLWFTVFHEAAHLLQHRKMLFVEGIDGLSKDQEEEADRFARDRLIPPKDASRLQQLAASQRVSKAMVRQFADEIGIAPGIVVGRMQKEGWLPWSHLNDLKVRYRWANEQA